MHDDAVGTGGGRFFNVELAAEGTQLLAQAGPSRRDFHEERTRVVWLACRLLRELRQWRPCSTLVAESLALELAGCALRHAERPPSSPPGWLARVVQQLHDEPHRRHSTAALAREAGVHPVHLAAVFRRFHRQSVGEYVRTMRIGRRRCCCAAATCRSPRRPCCSASPTRPISPGSSAASWGCHRARSGGCSHERRAPGRREWSFDLDRHDR